MQYIQDACLMNIVVGSMLSGKEYNPVSFTWDLINNHRTIFNEEYNFEDAQVLLQLSLMVTTANFNTRSLDAPEWLEDTPLVYDSCPMVLISQLLPKSSINKEGVLGHFLYDRENNNLFIIFTGTSNACMVGLDVEYSQTTIDGILNYNPGMKAHGGFYAMYKSIRNQIITLVMNYLNRNPKIIISGHSLGGALSQLCALDLAYYNPIHYSFASPLVFNPLGCEAFEKYVKYSYRIANLSDLIVMSPLPIMPNKEAFCHVGKLIHFQRNTGVYPLNHSLAYVEEYNLKFTYAK